MTATQSISAGSSSNSGRREKIYCDKWIGGLQKHQHFSAHLLLQEDRMNQTARSRARRTEARQAQARPPHEAAEAALTPLARRHSKPGPKQGRSRYVPLPPSAMSSNIHCPSRKGQGYARPERVAESASRPESRSPLTTLQEAIDEVGDTLKQILVGWHDWAPELIQEQEAAVAPRRIDVGGFPNLERITMN
ncbi:hypothetical protein DHEL01_v208864 [Diaporthe helianthi]|uniref:Uncharacterized protein n=1 Tax=Diaporthe helianthi TaxID=158607 RepID=A0A2P5HR40_DIAHE|nr:hypothetical protein DHEL01_v208864 [Diaporthe helianthi]